MDLNVIKITADAFDWTIERTAQSLQTFLDGNYHLVAFLIRITYSVLKSIAETISFSGYVLRCYYLDFLAFLSELNTGLGFVFSVIYGFCTRIVLTVLSGIGCISGAISLLYGRIVFSFQLVGDYIALCVEELFYLINVCFAAVLLILQLGPNFVLFLWDIILLCVTNIFYYFHYNSLSVLNFCANVCDKSFLFILAIPPKAYIGLLLLLYIFYKRVTVVEYFKLTLKSLVVYATKILLYLWTAIKLLINFLRVFTNKIWKRGEGTRRSEGTFNLLFKSVFIRYFSIVPFLTLSVFRKRQTQVLDSTEREKFLCVVCQDKEKNVLLIPCRHLCLCEECAAAVRRSYLGCPLCRKQIIDTVVVYT